MARDTARRICARKRRAVIGIVAGAMVVVAALAVANSLSWFGHRSTGARNPSQTRPPERGPERKVDGIGVLRLGSSWNDARGYGRYADLIVSRGYAGEAAHAPGRSLVHFSGADVSSRYSTGVPYTVALARGWLLRASDGTLLRNRGYPGNYIADVANRAYQRMWIGDVSRFLRVNGDDGVMIDDVVRDVEPLAGRYPAKYPTQRVWQDAMASFVAAAGKALRKRGFYVAVNASGYTPGDPRSNDGSLDVAWWRQLAPSVDGLVNEFYAENSSGDNAVRSSGGGAGGNWAGWQRLIRVAEEVGKDFIGITYGASNDTRTMAYARASFLQDWDGGSSTFIYNPTDNSDPWNRVWTASIGRPAAPKARVGVGWERKYTGGIALVNPSASQSQLFDLGGSYRTAEGKTVTSVELDATTGLVLDSTRG